MPKFSPVGMWARLRKSYPPDGPPSPEAITVFTGVRLSCGAIQVTAGQALLWCLFTALQVTGTTIVPVHVRRPRPRMRPIPALTTFTQPFRGVCASCDTVLF